MIEIYIKPDDSYRVIYPDNPNSDLNNYCFDSSYKGQMDKLVSEGKAVLKDIVEYVPTTRESRKNAYGKIEDQLDFIVHNGIDAYIQKHQDIKTQFPKD